MYIYIHTNIYIYIQIYICTHRLCVKKQERRIAVAELRANATTNTLKTAAVVEGMCNDRCDDVQ